MGLAVHTSAFTAHRSVIPGKLWFAGNFNSNMGKLTVSVCIVCPIDGPFLFPLSVSVELATFVFACLSIGYPVGEELVVLLLVYYFIFFLVSTILSE